MTMALLPPITHELSDPEAPLLARDILGTDQPRAIAVIAAQTCQALLGSASISCDFFELSVGAVFGLTLADGRRIVLKCFRPQDHPPGSIEANHRIQQALYLAGFPCPAVLASPTSRGVFIASAQARLDRGERANAHEPATRRAMAHALHRLIQIGSTLDLRGIPYATDAPDISPDKPLWPRGHNALFDFERTAGGAQWIEALGRWGRRRRTGPVGTRVLGHTDWSAKHFRMENGNITAVYDWDSLVIDREPRIVGNAAPHFTTTWYLDVEPAPTPEALCAFIADYETARGRAFSHAERRVVFATAVEAIAYTARCEHALEPGGMLGPFGTLLLEAGPELLNHAEPPTPPLLETERLRLRRLRWSDVRHLIELESDAEVMRYIGDGRTHSPHDIISQLPQVLDAYAQHRGMGVFAAERRSDQQFLGWLALKPLPESNDIEVGYRILRRFWGQGFATEGTRALLTFGREHLGLDRIVAIAKPNNRASLRVMQKAGMRLVGPTLYNQENVLLYDA